MMADCKFILVDVTTNWEIFDGRVYRKSITPECLDKKYLNAPKRTN